jgi:2-hydroxy-3-keto-5-methylthiopentenyl-1-phosphate phosphatase
LQQQRSPRHGSTRSRAAPRRFGFEPAAFGVKNRAVTGIQKTASPLGVVCDFDGTATLLDIGDEVSRHFGGAAHWEDRSAAFRRGELDTRGVIEGIYETVTASEAELRAYAVSVARLRPGFAELIDACRARSAPFILASGGLRQYIEPVLDAQLGPETLRHVHLRANEAVFEPAPWKVRFPGEVAARELGCTACGSCKRVSVAALRAAGVRHVIGIGDGFADRCLAQSADAIFAREGSYLHRYCVEKGLPHTAFTTLEGAAQAVAAYQAA